MDDLWKTYVKCIENVRMWHAFVFECDESAFIINVLIHQVETNWFKLWLIFLEIRSQILTYEVAAVNRFDEYF